MCAKYLSVLVQALGVLGTLLLAAIAIWNKQIIYWLAGPKLKLKLGPKGSRFVEAARCGIYYCHLFLTNERPSAPAEKVRVMMLALYRAGPQGNFLKIGPIAPIQFTFPYPDVTGHDASPTVRSSIMCDFLVAGGTLEFCTYVQPMGFIPRVEPKEKVRVLIRAEAHNAVSNDLLVEICWDGTPLGEGHLVDEQVKIDEVDQGSLR